MSHQTPWYSEIWAASVHRTHGGVSWNHQSVLALSSKVFRKPSAESWKAEGKRKALCLVTGQTVYIDREMWFPNLCTFWKSTANCLECLFLSFLFIYFCMGWGWGTGFFSSAWNLPSRDREAESPELWLSLTSQNWDYKQAQPYLLWHWL